MQCRPGLAFAAALTLLTACSSRDGSFSWTFVSRPDLSGGSNDDGGSVIVIRRTSLVAAGSEPGFAWHRVQGVGARGPVTVSLATSADAAVLEHQDAVEVRSPTLNRAVLRVRGGTLLAHPSGPVVFEVAVPEAGALDPAASGSGTLWVASGGNLVVLRHEAGVIVWGEARDPQHFALPHGISVDDQAIQLLLPGGRSRPLRPAAVATLAQRVQQDRGRGSLRVFGTRGELVAELPVANVQLFDGSQGVFLTANLPRGVDVRDPRPMVLLMAKDNRHLLRLED